MYKPKSIKWSRRMARVEYSRESKIRRQIFLKKCWLREMFHS